MILALHGFLGLPQDWRPFDRAFLAPDGRPLELRKWNLYRDLPSKPPSSEVYPLRIWAREFCRRIREEISGSGGGVRKPALLGYSMGGRLALHALLEAPELFSCAVLIGAHPGLDAEDLRLQRRLNDARWAERFRSEDWSVLMRAWGEQDVFRTERCDDSIELRRFEVDFDRIALARAMQVWSLAAQENLRPYLAETSVPTLWLHGASDRRFRDLYRDLGLDLADCRAHAIAEVPRAGHRIPWDNPSGFVVEVQQFFSQINGL